MTIPLQTPAGTAPPVVGILGGGQLGRMMAPAAHRLGVQLYALDPQGSASPFGQLGYPCLEGSFADEAKLQELAKHCDVLTVEIEHVNAQALKKLQDSGSVTVHPAPDTIALIQDKLQQKRFFQDKSGVEVAPFSQVSSLEDARKVGQEYGYPYMLKSRRDAYDGKGNAVVHSADDMESAFQSLGIKDTSATDLLLYAEKWVPFTKELAVMVVKQNDQVKAYPVVETAQENSVCATVLAPAQFQSQSTYDQAIHMALSAIDCLEGNGIYGVELFLTENNGEEKVYLNEIAPRPHNSGHYTIEACATDQFEQHVRAVSGLPLGSCDLKVGASLMVNVLGDPSGQEKSSFAILQQSLTIPGAIPHFYGKQGVRPGRKLGHVTLVADDLGELRTRASQLVKNVPDTTPGVASLRQVTALPSQDNLVGVKAGAKVGIVMGSDSDLSTMQAAAKVLDQFGVPYELTIVSAHRTAHRMYQYAETAAARGLHVIIAGAGGAAHLPGMIAAITPLPVVGVPVKTSTLNGEDSLLSIVQMPRGVPVATVAIGNAMNAGLLAVRMLGGKYTAKMQQFLEDQKAEVDGKIEKLASVGWEQYLAQ